MAFKADVTLILLESFRASIFIKDNTPDEYNHRDEMEHARTMVSDSTGINLETWEVELLFRSYERNGYRPAPQQPKQAGLYP